MRDAQSRRAPLRTAAIAGLALGAGLCAAADSPFKLLSSAIVPNSSIAADQVYSGFGCTGKNLSPPLIWSGAPEGTQSFALTMYDPDAPTGSGWWHWVVYDIPASVTVLDAGAGNPGGKLPLGAVQGRTDYGTTGYGGPCPPKGDKPHRYILTVYALKTARLDVPAGSSAAMVGFAIGANKLSSASIAAFYGR